MRKSNLTALMIILVFLGVWFFLASSPVPYWQEGDHIDWGYGMYRTGSIHYFWDTNINQAVFKDLKFNRGFILAYLCSFAFRLPGDPILWCRSILLLFTLLIYLTMVLYYRYRGVLTPQRLFTWTVLFFCSSTILFLSYYTRPYMMLGAAMTATFILYWEGLEAFRKNNKKQALFLWVLGLIPVSISVIDQWQIEGIPALGIAIATSMGALNQRWAPLLGWIKRKSGWIVLGAILLSPFSIKLISLFSWIKIGGFAPFILTYHQSFWDNCIGWLRFIFAINIGFLALKWAFKTKTPMTFDRWMFVNGFLTGIICILYNPDAPIFQINYVYLPTLMMIIGLSGIMEDYFTKSSFRKNMLIIYVVINIGIAWVNIFEHNNERLSIQWLNTHLRHDDLLITDDKVGSPLLFCGGQDLLARRYMIDSSGPSETQKEIELKNYINAHPQGRIFFLYSDGNSDRTWLCKLTLGKDLDPPVDLWSHLRLKIPSTPVVAGLRLCGLVEFDRAVLLQGLDHLLTKGFDPKPHYSLKDFFHHFGL